MHTSSSAIVSRLPKHNEIQKFKTFVSEETQLNYRIYFCQIKKIFKFDNCNFILEWYTSINLSFSDWLLHGNTLWQRCNSVIYITW